MSVSDGNVGEGLKRFEEAGVAAPFIFGPPQPLARTCRYHRSPSSISERDGAPTVRSSESSFLTPVSISPTPFHLLAPGAVPHFKSGPRV